MLEPTSDNKAIFSEAMKALQTGRFDDTYNMTKDLFALEPSDPDTLRLYGASCFLLRNQNEAQKCLEQIQNLDQSIGLPILDFWAQHLASNLIYDTAAFLYGLILENEPENGDARVTYARFLMGSNQFDKALKELDLLKKNHEDLYRVWELDTEVNLAQGNKEAAKEAALKAIEVNPLSYKGFHDLVDITKGDAKVISNLNIEAFVAGAESNETHPTIRSQLNFTLGLLFEHQNDYEYAFKHYEIANNILGELYNLKNVVYNPQEIEDYSKSLKEVFGTPLTDKETGSTDQTPIFILGLPRSGTTLVEQILSAHSKVDARGEGNVLPNFANNICSTAVLDGVEDARENALGRLDNLRKDFLGEDQSSPFIVDKTMTNFFHLGLIKDLFPNAIFIHLKRDKMATCFSNYVHNLSHYYAYSTSLKNTRHFYKTCEAMMKYWGETLDHDIYELDYQKLVKNPETEIKALLAHCGLKFEKACLSPEKSKNPVLTMSATALNEPINVDAISRWENFKPYLTELT